MTKVAYAGRPQRLGSPSADTLFRQGRSTLEIAQYFGVSEAKVLRRISVMRSRRLRLPSPYSE